MLRVCSQTWGKVQYWHFYWKFNEFNSGLASIRCKARINGSNRIPINLDSLYQDSYNIFLEFKLFIHWFDKSNELCLHVSLLLPFHGGGCTASHTRSFKPEENLCTPCRGGWLNQRPCTNALEKIQTLLVWELLPVSWLASSKSSPHLILSSFKSTYYVLVDDTLCCVRLVPTFQSKRWVIYPI